jgi:hypothetical protein
MKAKVTTIILLFSVVILSGCLSANPGRQTISQWIPPGTPQEDAVRIMKQHGFESGPCGSEWRRPKGEAVFYFGHETKILKNTHYFFVHFKDGKAVSIGGPWTSNDFFDFLYHYEKSGG